MSVTANTRTHPGNFTESLHIVLRKFSKSAFLFYLRSADHWALTEEIAIKSQNKAL